MLEATDPYRNSPGTISCGATPRDVAAVLFRHGRLMTVAFGVAFLALTVYVILSPRYEARLKILVRRARLDPPVSPQAKDSIDVDRPEVSEEQLNSEAELLGDRSLLQDAVRAARLVPPGAEPARVEREARTLSRHLSIEPVRKSNMIEATYRASSPNQAASVLTALTAIYLQRHTELQRPSGEFDFFTQQAASSEFRLQESERRLVKFTEMRGVASASLERDIALQKLGDAEANYRQIREDRADTDKRIAALREQLTLFPPRSLTELHSADNPELLEKLKTRLLDLQLKRTELLTRYEPSYRLVQEVEEQIAQTRQALSGEAIAPVRDETTDKDPNYEWARMELEKAQVQNESLRAREAAASAEIATLRESAMRLQSDSITQQGLLRSAKADEDAYLLYLRKQEEARIGDALDERHIVNVAVVEAPVAPALPVHSIPFYLLLALGVSSVCALTTAFAAERVDPTIRTPDEACHLLEVPVLAWLPAEDTEAAFATAIPPQRSKAERR